MGVEIVHMDANIITNTVSTLVTLGGVGYFFNKWMVAREKKGDSDRAEIKERLERTDDFVIRSLAEIKHSIDGLSEHVAKANGRTAKLEGCINAVKEVCEERHHGRRKSEGEY